MTGNEQAGRAEWVSIGEFFEEYLDVMDAEGVLDYAELVHRSRILLTDPEVVATLRAEIGCVFVDEYQDTDPGQVALLHELAGDGRNLTVVGDMNADGTPEVIGIGPEGNLYRYTLTANGFIGASVVVLVENVLSSYVDRWPTALGAVAWGAGAAAWCVVVVMRLSQDFKWT